MKEINKVHKATQQPMLQAEKDLQTLLNLDKRELVKYLQNNRKGVTSHECK